MKNMLLRRHKFEDGHATMADVDKYRSEAVLGTAPPVFRARFGPCSIKVARFCGAHAPAFSIVYEIVSIDEKVQQDLHACIPNELIPRADDTVETLFARLSESDYFDVMPVLQGGNGGKKGSKKRVDLNDTDYSMPRRKTWSVLVRGEHFDADHDRVRTMYLYSSSQLEPKDWQTEPMPMPVFIFGVHIFHGLRNHGMLSPASMHSPPNACQVLFYYGAFVPHLSRHKDNFTVREFLEVMRHCFMPQPEGLHEGDVREPRVDVEKLVADAKRKIASGECAGTPQSGSANSQLIGSDVLVYSMGNVDMDFRLCFPPKGDRLEASLREYDITPSYTFPLGPGTVFVFRGLDDFLFAHETSMDYQIDWYPKVNPSRNPQHFYRIAFVYRWLELQRDFFAETDCMKVPREMRDRQKEKEAAERRGKAKRKSDELRGPFP